MVVVGYLVAQFRDRQISRLQENSILKVPNISQKYPNFPLSDYGFLLQVRRNQRVQLLFLALTGQAQTVELIYEWVNINQVKTIANSDRSHSQLAAAQEIQPILKDYLQTAPDLELLNQQLQRLRQALETSSPQDLAILRQQENSIHHLQRQVDVAQQLHQDFQRYLYSILACLPGEFPVNAENSRYQEYRDTYLAYQSLLPGTDSQDWAIDRL